VSLGAAYAVQSRKAAHAFHARGSHAAEDWVRERLLEIPRGHCSLVAAGMRRSATLRKLPQADRAPVDTCADYLLKYADFLRYDEYLANGLPIASGVIEGACRYLVQDRMGITGRESSLIEPPSRRVFWADILSTGL
jgi:hypothetical protein